MRAARADGAERSARRVRLAVVVVSPALDRAAGVQPAGVVPACTDGAERLARRVRLAGAVGSPAHDCAAGAQPAGVRIARADGAERSARRVRPAVAVVSPALDRARVEQRAGVLVTDRDRDCPLAALRLRASRTAGDAECCRGDHHHRRKYGGRQGRTPPAPDSHSHGSNSLSEPRTAARVYRSAASSAALARASASAFWARGMWRISNSSNFSASFCSSAWSGFRAAFFTR